MPKFLEKTVLSHLWGKMKNEINQHHKTDPDFYKTNVDLNGKLIAETVADEMEYAEISPNAFISKGTLNTVINGLGINALRQNRSRFMGTVFDFDHLPSTQSSQVGDIYHVRSESRDYRLIQFGYPIDQKKWMPIGLPITTTDESTFYIDDVHVSDGAYYLRVARKIKSRYTDNEMAIVAPAFLFMTGDNAIIYDTIGYHKITLTQAVWQPEILTAQSVTEEITEAVTPKESTSNKVTSLSAESTDTQYPSAKAVYELVGDVESLLGGI